MESVKKILPFILVAIVFAIAGYFVGSGSFSEGEASIYRTTVPVSQMKNPTSGFSSTLSVNTSANPGKYKDCSASQTGNTTCAWSCNTIDDDVNSDTYGDVIGTSSGVGHITGSGICKPDIRANGPDIGSKPASTTVKSTQTKTQ